MLHMIIRELITGCIAGFNKTKGELIKGILLNMINS